MIQIRIIFIYTDKPSVSIELPAVPRKGDIVKVKGIYYKTHSIIFYDDLPYVEVRLEENLNG